MEISQMQSKPDLGGARRGLASTGGGRGGREGRGAGIRGKGGGREGSCLVDDAKARVRGNVQGRSPAWAVLPGAAIDGQRGARRECAAPTASLRVGRKLSWG